MLRKWISTGDRYPTVGTPVLCRWILERGPEIQDVAYRKANGIWLDMEGKYLKEPDYWMETMGLRQVRRDLREAGQRTCQNCTCWSELTKICDKLRTHGRFLAIASDRMYGLITPPGFGCIYFEKRPEKEPAARHFFVDALGDVRCGDSWFGAMELKSREVKVVLERLCAWINSVLEKGP